MSAASEPVTRDVFGTPRPLIQRIYTSYGTCSSKPGGVTIATIRDGGGRDEGVLTLRAITISKNQDATSDLW